MLCNVRVRVFFLTCARSCSEYAPLMSTTTSVGDIGSRPSRKRCARWRSYSMCFLFCTPPPRLSSRQTLRHLSAHRVHLTSSRVSPPWNMASSSKFQANLKSGILTLPSLLRPLPLLTAIPLGACGLVTFKALNPCLDLDGRPKNQKKIRAGILYLWENCIFFLLEKTLKCNLPPINDRKTTRLQGVITRYYSNRGVSFSFRRVPSIWRSQSGFISIHCSSQKAKKKLRTVSE